MTDFTKLEELTKDFKADMIGLISHYEVDVKNLSKGVLSPEITLNCDSYNTTSSSIPIHIYSITTKMEVL